MKSFVVKFWKWILAIGVIILVIIGGTRYTQGQQASSSVTTTRVKQGDFTKLVSSSGKTDADKSVDLKFQTSGKLAWVGVKEGDSIKAGQAIAKLDDREVQKNLQNALLDYSEQRNSFDETQQVTYGNQTVSDALTNSVRRILQKNQWDLNKAVIDVELQSLAVEFSTLTSPISGIVTHIDTPVAGVNITPATAVFTVSDPGSLVFTANVDETDVGNLALGQSANITLDAFPEATFSGKVSYISYSSELSSGGATVFPIKILFDSPANLRIGLNGDAAVEVSKLTDVLTVPTEAIREETNGTYVYRKTKTGYAKTAVTTGARNDTVVVVTSGLSSGDSVVTKGFSAISK